MRNKTRISAVLALGLGATVAGCGSSPGTNPNIGTPMNYQHSGDAVSTNPVGGGLPFSPGSGALVDPTVDYLQALRTASLKLRGTLPSLDEQLRLQTAINSTNPTDAQLLYESMVHDFIYAPQWTANFNRPKLHPKQVRLPDSPGRRATWGMKPA